MVVSICSVSERKAMPRVLSSLTVVRRVRQRPTQPVELPNDQAVAGLNKSEGFGKAGTITPAAAGPVLEQVTPVDASGQERVALQVEHLAFAVSRDAHVADQHVRKTSLGRFPYHVSFRQGLSYGF